LAHEFFHVLEFSYNTTISCPGFWFTEASAKWAEWWFAPATAGTEVYPWASDFLDHPEVSLTESTAGHGYESWLWPLFMQQQAGGSTSSIVGAWSAMVGQTGCAALNNAINAQLPFAANFTNFAAENFDYELPNTATHALAWPVPAAPVTFTGNYPDFTASFNPIAPAFPEMRPKAGEVNLAQSTSYPWTATVPVNLPPLSAQYTRIVLNPAKIAHGGAVEFDFTGLSPSASLDVNLLGADSQKSGYAINNGVWERIDVGRSNGSGVATHANICLNADGTRPSVKGNGKNGYPVGGSLYVIIDNNGASNTPLTGSFTVTQRDTCATALSGQLTINSSASNSGPQTVTNSAQITADLTNNCATCNFYPWQVTGTWSAQTTDTISCGTLTGSASRALTSADFSNGPGVLGAGAMSLYSNPYRYAPYIAGAFLSGEQATGTWSGCGGGTSTIGLDTGYGCPAMFSPVSSGAIYRSRGVYTSADASVTFNCFTSKNGYSDTINGTLTATDPVQCGLWPYCFSGPGHSSRSQTRRLIHPMHKQRRASTRIGQALGGTPATSTTRSRAGGR
jgi:hypothetical protein